LQRDVVAILATAAIDRDDEVSPGITER